VLFAERRRDRRIEKMARDRERLEGLSVPRRMGGGSRRSVTAVLFVLLVWGGLFAAEEQHKGPDTSHAFTFMETQDSSSDPVTYDPCGPIHLVVDSRTMVHDGMRLLQDGLDEVQDATGLTFIVDGLVDEPPLSGGAIFAADGEPRPVRVSWSDPRAETELKGKVSGVGGSAWVESSDGRRWYVTGTIVLDGPQIARVIERPHGWQAARAIVMHELGHLVGLDHVDVPGQLMQPELRWSHTTWGVGDRKGLAALGGDCTDFS
jgi:hypothetical protein